MVSRQIIRPGQTDDVPPHGHDATQISGTFNFVRILKALIDGDLAITGFIRTAESGRRIEIRPDSGTGLVPSIQFFTDVAGEAGFIEVRDVGGTEGTVIVAPGGENTSIILRQTNNMSLILDNTETLAAVLGQLRFPDGDASAPGISWLAANQQDVGFFRVSDDVIGITTGGAEVARFTGTAGHNLDGLAWTTWTPGDGTGFTIGNGASAGRYVQIGNTVTAVGHIRLGSTSVIGAGCSTTFPVTPHADYVNAVSPVGVVHFYDDSAGATYPGGIRHEASNRLRFLTHASPHGGVTGTAPFTWAVNDRFDFFLTYEAA